MSLQVVSDGVWLSGLGAVGELQFSTVIAGGCGPASWSMTLPPRFSHPALRRGKVVQIKAGSWNLCSGLLTEPDRSDEGKWTFHARGLAEEADRYLCLDSSGDTTTTPDVAIARAIADGWQVTLPSSISAVPFAATDQTRDLNTVADLLDAYCSANGLRWGVDGDRRLYVRTDPTTPTWHMPPGTARFGLADDNYVTDVWMTYYDAAYTIQIAHAEDAAAAAQYGRVEKRVDGTRYGVLDSTAAGDIADGLLADAGPRLGWTNTVSPNRWQITTPGGSPAWLPAVSGGQMVRSWGVLDEQGQPMPYVDWLISEAVYKASDDTISLAPVGLVERDLESVLAGSAA